MPSARDLRKKSSLYNTRIKDDFYFSVYTWIIRELEKIKSDKKFSNQFLGVKK